MPGSEGLGGGSVGVGEGLVGGEGGECGVGVLVGGGDVSVSSCSGVYVSAVEVLLDMRPGLGQPGVPVVEQRVGFRGWLGLFRWGASQTWWVSRLGGLGR